MVGVGTGGVNATLRLGKGRITKLKRGDLEEGLMGGRWCRFGLRGRRFRLSMAFAGLHGR